MLHSSTKEDPKDMGTANEQSGKRNEGGSPFQAEQERGPLGELVEFDCGSFHRCAGKGIHII
jgi:hypothetical protein